MTSLRVAHVNATIAGNDVRLAIAHSLALSVKLGTGKAYNIANTEFKEGCRNATLSHPIE